ncbi:MAG: magnesium transporter CorA family protein [Prevotella sp.]|nr:magnesium transporter CorA family protein [Prevotella sp.]MCM1075593.1 magnesium transporter CorA family protein [Ruminococcus sp.]
MRDVLVSEHGWTRVESLRSGCWVNVVCPDVDDLNFLREELNIPADFIEDIHDVDERPRVEIDGDWILTIVRIPRRCGEGDVPFITVPIGLITNGDVLVSICCYETELVDDFISHCGQRRISIESTSELVIRFVYSSAYWFLQYLKELNAMSEVAVQQLERSIRNRDLLRLMRLQRSLVYFSTSIKGNQVMTDRLRSLFEKRDSLDADLLEDVEIELRQANDTVNIYNTILGGTMDTFASVISNNVNAIMKRMTSISITLMIPTLIASFFGMNVKMYLTQEWWSFAVIILISAVLSLLSVVWFKRIKWF